MNVDVGGVRLECQEQGRGSPVLLVHGTAANLWGELPARLAARYRVISYDRRSFGASQHEPLADLSRHASDAALLLKALDASPAIVVGWSIGGVVAVELALRHPEAVDAVVILEAPLHAKRRPSLPMVKAIVGAQILARLRSPSAGARAFLRWALGRRSGGDDLSNAPPDWRDAILANGEAIVRELAAGTGEHVPAERLREITVPIRWLVGDMSDRVFLAAAERAAERAPAISIVQVERSGHCLQWDRPDAVVDAVDGVASALTNRRAVNP